MRHLLTCLVVVLTAAGLRAAEPAPSSTSEPQSRDRLNLYPLLYIDDEEVSVLTPFFRKTSDDVALRPLFAWNWTRQRLRVLYPLAEFRFGAGEGWVLNCLWGPRFTCVFPLYWDTRRENGRTNTLIPLWHYHREGAHTRWATALGLVGAESSPEERHHRVLPLYSLRRGPGADFSHWFGGPLAHFWNDASARSSGGWLLPLYFTRTVREASLRLSPLWASWRDEADGSGGHAVIPLYAREDRPDGRSIWTLAGADHRRGEAHDWWWWPLLSAGSSSTGTSSRWSPFPLVYRRVDAGGLTSMVAPFYLRRDSGTASLLLTPLGGAWHDTADGSGGHAVVPFYARTDRPDGRSIWTLAGADHRRGETHDWWWWPLLSAGSSSPAGHARWTPFPLVRSRDDGRERVFHVAPFWFSRASEEGSSLITPVYAERTTGEARLRVIPPLLSWAREDGAARSAWILAPFAHFARGADSVSRHVFPFFYQSRAEGRSAFATLLGGRITEPGRTTNLIYPLLSWRTRTPERTDTWALAPLAHLSQGAARGSSHVFPLFYHHPVTGFFASLPWLSWKDDAGAVWRSVPPLASWWSREGGRLRGRFLAGLAGLGGPADAGWSYLLPVFHRDRAKDSFLSLPYARWRDPSGASWQAIPPLATWWSHEDGRLRGRFLAGLGGMGGTVDAAWSYLAPLFYRNAARDAVVSLPYARWRDALDRTWHALPPLATWWTRSGGEIEGRFLGGLAGASGAGDQRVSYVIPFYLRDRTRDLLVTPLYGRWSDGAAGRTHLLPLLLSWWHEGDGSSFSRHQLAGLAGQGRDADSSWSYLIPLYYRDSGGDLLTPLAGRLVSGEKTWNYWATPLVGTFADAARTGGYLFPLAGWSSARDGSERSARFLWARSWRQPDSSGSSCFPLWNAGRDTWTRDGDAQVREHLNIGFLSRWTRSETRYGAALTKNRAYTLWPLWSARKTEQEGERKVETRRQSALFGLLYRHQEQTLEGKVVESDRRVLSYAYRHRVNADGSVRSDLFPSITYDARPDGYAKRTFLWRVWFWERQPDGQVRRSILGLRF